MPTNRFSKRPLVSRTSSCQLIICEMRANNFILLKIEICKSQATAIVNADLCLYLYFGFGFAFGFGFEFDVVVVVVVEFHLHIIFNFSCCALALPKTLEVLPVVAFLMNSFTYKAAR